MAYQPTRRVVNVLPLPKFEIDGVTITSRQFMHDEWWYVVDNTWCVETSILVNNKGA